MRTYKLWIEIERYDDETDECMDITNGDASDEFTEPVPIGEFATLDEARDYAESIATDKPYGGAD